MNVAGLAAQVGLSWHTTAYHLRSLDRAGSIVIDRWGRDRHVFPSGLSQRQMQRLALLRPGLAREVCMALLESRPRSIQSLARQLGRSSKMVQRQVTNLVDGGLVERHGAWRPVFQVRRTEARAVARLLAKRRRHQEGPPASQAVSTAVQADLGGGPRFGTWEWLLEGDRVALSDAAWRISGLERQASTTSQWLLSCVHPDDLPWFEAVLADAVAEGKSFDVLVRRTADGGGHLVRLRGKATAHDEGGRPLRFAGTVEAVSKRQASARTGPHAKAASPPPAPPASRGAVARALDRVAQAARTIGRGFGPRAPISPALRSPHQP